MATTKFVQASAVGLFWVTITLTAAARAAEPTPLPGTAPLTTEGDLAAQMVDGIHRFLDAETAASVERRARHWKRDFSSPEAYEKSIAPNRARLAEIIGAVDPRVPFQQLSTKHSEIARWPVLRGAEGSMIEAEGLLLDPEQADWQAVANVIVLTDADVSPEQAANQAYPGNANIAAAEWFYERRCRVLVPLLMDRDDLLSVVAGTRKTNQPHREFLYRQSYELGRHLIGYEVQKVLAAVDYFSKKHDSTPLVVYGHGEGGLLALYAAALDPRIDAVQVSGYFDSRQNLWQEPIYRNVWSLLDEFGDAELAAMIAPRPLIVSATPFPAITGPPAPREGRSGAAPGRLRTPSVETVKAEVARANKLVEELYLPSHVKLHDEKTSLFRVLRIEVPPAIGTLYAPIEEVDTADRRKRQFEQMASYTQALMREAEYTRQEYWAAADRSSVETWEKSTETYRDKFYDDVIGRFDRKLLPAAPRTRLIYDEPKFTGYEVMLDVFPDVYAYGILLVPKDIKEGEQRPVVVCQHGLEGRPQDVADPKIDSPYYHKFACQLAERGFVTYAPQNPYIGEDRFRSLQRKANPLGKSLFSIIIPQHQQTVRWLGTLPFVDAKRIGFYGLSYGGKTAMRVPAVVKEYCLSICSADFNEWIWKNASTRSPYSYMATGEYEMFEFNLGNTFNYSDMAGLIAPRPFMVERGHHDGVAPDEWVAYEYAKVRKLYSDLKIPERTTIEFFDGPHTIHGVGTFAFLHEHLNWPERN